ncbi:MAG TPA: SUMF1/EgtB/PvdO family nonheme iron enzyme [Myxococcota bacterium]|nr:SUMF1/EgtB/PvdO family nonheme iron enzyme [Myxococcota bacterium]
MIGIRNRMIVLASFCGTLIWAGCGGGIPVNDSIEEIQDSVAESDAPPDSLIPPDSEDDARPDSIQVPDAVPDSADASDIAQEDLQTDPGDDAVDFEIDAGSDVGDVDDSGLADDGSDTDADDVKAGDLSDGGDGDAIADQDVTDDSVMYDVQSDSADPGFSPTICRPCRVDSDCAAEGYQPVASCIPVSDPSGLAGSFCLIPCLEDSGCPDGYECLDSDDSGNKACYWAGGDGQPCECGVLQSGADTSCTRANIHGTCEGVAECTLTGFAPCGAAIPAAEICDDVDNDCDGLTDEFLGSSPCGLGECQHDVLNCVDGNPGNCEPMQGAVVETCDGKDNDCDGMTDQGFLFTEVDGSQLAKGADCGVGACAGGTVVCSPDQLGLTCDSLYKSSIEILNDIDDDCDGLIDEGLCRPDCTGRECGGDGCGGSCGTCALGYSCGSSGICVPDGMVQVPFSMFYMGCDPATDPACRPGENPRHYVTISGFFIDRTEVTVAAYALCVGAGACSATRTEGLCQWGHSGREQYPINCVTWEQAQSYCSWVGKRLPTEAEWELAARGTDERLYPWGNGAPSCGLAVMLESTTPGCGTGVPAIPCSRSPAGDSPFGACDMSGNVQEWVFDWYDPNYYSSSPPLNPHGPDAGSTRVTRGGHYAVHDAAWLRSAARGEAAASIDGVETGFRCAKTH